MNQKKRRVWKLESGFNTKNTERDEWFQKNPAFLVTHSKKTGHLVFQPLTFGYATQSEINDWQGGNFWETTTATEIKRSDDGRYRCFETNSGTKYHLWNAGELTLA